MHVTYGSTKDAINLEKHGVSLQLANLLEWEWLQAKRDSRTDYGELRMIGFAPIGDRVYCVVFVDRGDVDHIISRRVISLRKANAREVKRYANIKT